MKKIASRQLIYSKKNPPFHAFLTLFTPANSKSSTSKLGYFPCQQIVGTLTQQNSNYENFPLSSWLADLVMEASPALREKYLADLVDSYAKSLAQPTQNSKTNFVRQITSLVEEERKGYRTFIICNAVMPLIVKGVPNHLHNFSGILRFIHFLNIDLTLAIYS